MDYLEHPATRSLLLKRTISVRHQIITTATVANAPIHSWSSSNSKKERKEKKQLVTRMTLLSCLSGRERSSDGACRWHDSISISIAFGTDK